MSAAEDALLSLLRRRARPLTGAPGDHDALLDLVGDARLVLLGEGSHGTHDFYAERARITRRLVEERGFTAVAVEADWPDAYRVNRFVGGEGEDASAAEALSGFERFPTWMWRNVDVLTFVDWLREYNAALPAARPPVGFYGLDLYSLFTSIAEVVRVLETLDPEAARHARARYACFDHFGEDSQAYGYAAEFGADRGCEDQAVAQLLELRRRAAEAPRRDGPGVEEELFHAEQNARLVKNAEEYYRSMFRGRVSSWNLRDCHMADTLDALLAHLDRRGGRAKVVVWAHNSHLGDARATRMGDAGEWNVGQLARERHGDDAVLVGFTTHTGTVTAADDWDEPAERMRVQPSLPGSWERLLHDVGVPRFLLPLRGDPELEEALREPRLERAIGVIYRPRTERASHYFEARLSEQFDAVVHLDETRAVEPLEPSGRWHAGEEAPETFPSGV